MFMAMDTVTMDGTIRRTEARGVRGAALQDHLFIRRCLRSQWGYPTNHLHRLALEGVGTSAKETRIGIATATEIVGGSESGRDMEGQLREAGVVVQTKLTVVDSVGVCRIHRVRVRHLHFPRRRCVTSGPPSGIANDSMSA